MDLLTFFKGQRLSPAPSDDFWYGNPANNTVAGVNVDEARALTYSACWAATMLLSSSAGMLPLKLFQKERAGGSRVADDHPVHQLINSRPNPEMTTMMFRASRVAQQVNRGNCFSEIERNKGGVPVNLWPIHASRIPARNVVRERGRIVYYINNDDGTKTPVRQENMLHVPSPISEDGIFGLGVITQARLSIGLGLATETHGASYFGAGATPKTVITGANKFKTKEEKEDFRRQWNEMHGGPQNANKPAILPDGMDIKTLNFSAEDSQFLETRQFSIEEVARWYGVPPHLIGHLLRATYSNIEHLSLEFVKYSLMRWLVLWEQEINRKLLTEEERKTMYAKHNVDALERGDLASRTAAFQQEFFNGKKTLNEWRAMDEENPIGPIGDVHFVQSAMVPVEVAAKGPQGAEKPEPEEPEVEDEPQTEPEPMAAMPNLDELRQEFQAKLDTLSSEKEEQLATNVQVASAELRQEVFSKLSELQRQREDDIKQSQQRHVETLDAVKNVAQAAESLSMAASQQLASLSGSIATISQAVVYCTNTLETQRTVQASIADSMMQVAMARMVSLEINAAKRCAAVPEKFTERIDEFYDKHRSVMLKNITGPVTAYLSAIGDSRKPIEVASNLADSHLEQSRAMLTGIKLKGNEQLQPLVESCVSKWHEERTQVIL